MDPHQHWEHIYAGQHDDQVSWFEPQPSVSLQLMEAAGLNQHTCVLDVGGGESRLIDALLARGLHCLAVLDVSETALQRVRSRLRESASIPMWIAADITGRWSVPAMDIWHDRAVFHFLTASADRRRYVDHLRQTLKMSGTAIIATFALDGPQTCSGFPVARYSPETLATEVGEDFHLLDSIPHVHITPRGARQAFQYSRFVRVR